MCDTRPPVIVFLGRTVTFVVRCQVGVNRAARVVAREDGLKADNTVLVGDLDTAEEVCVEASHVRVHDARVDTRGVAAPVVDGYLGDREAVVDIDVLGLDVHRHTSSDGTIFQQVAANVLANDVVGTIGDIRSQQARRVAGEDDRRVSLRGVADKPGHVVVEGLELLKGSKISTVLLGL